MVACCSYGVKYSIAHVAGLCTMSTEPEVNHVDVLRTVIGI